MVKVKAYLFVFSIWIILAACSSSPTATCIPTLAADSPIVKVTETALSQTTETEETPPSLPAVTLTNTATAAETPTLEPTPSRVLALANPPLEGEDVLAMQQRLFALGFREVGTASGVFDSQSEAALKHFQWLNHMEITGGLDEKTAQRLFIEDAIAVSTRLYAYPGEIVSINTDPMLILNSGLTDRLVELGYIETLTSPLFTPETEEAVRAFQANNNLAVDGNLDYYDWQQLFSMWAIKADGEKEYEKPAELVDTHIFPVDQSPNMLAWDGERLWVGHEPGIDCSMSTVLSIDPEEGLIQAQTPIIVGDCVNGSTPMTEMIFAKNKLFLLFPGGTYNNPSAMMRVYSASSGEFLKEIIPYDCMVEYCLPGSAIGYDGSAIWMTSHTSAFAINATSVNLTGTRRDVTWLTAGKMVFDGRCMWMGSGDAGLTSFPVSGGSCPGSEMSWWVGTEDGAAWDGALLWGVDQYGYVKNFDPLTGLMVKVYPLDAASGVIAFDGERIWIAHKNGNTIQAIHAASGSLGEPIQVGNQPSALLFDGTRLWIANAGDNTVQTILPSDYEIEIIYPTPTATRKPDPTRIPTLAPVPFERTLFLTSPRMRGDDVLALQQQLLALGYVDVGTPDGVFGPMTEDAVTYFQLINELFVDGIVGPATWERLFGGSAWRP